MTDLTSASAMNPTATNRDDRDSRDGQAETATSREGPINQARSSSSLVVRRACGSRSDHVCPASSARGGGRDHDGHHHSRAADPNSISGCGCSCCRRNGKNGEDISALRDECSGGDAIDTVPCRERDEVPAAPGADKNEFAKLVERDGRCDAASRTTTNDEEAAETMEWMMPQSARGSTFYHHRKARCSSRPHSSSAAATSLMCDAASREENDRIACGGDSSGDKGKDSVSSSCHGTSIDFDDDCVAQNVVTSDRVRGHTSSIEDAWLKLTAPMSHQRSADSTTWRCQCEEPTLDLLGSSCGRHCDSCGHHRRHQRRDYFHRHCCCQQHDSPVNAERCETHGHICDGRARHKSWRDPMREENSRLYARRCYSKDSDIISAARERKDEVRAANENEDDEDEDDDNVGVINHRDSMCILAEKYKAGRRWRARRCEDQASPSAADGTTGKDECNKSLTSEIIDQLRLPESANAAAPQREESSVKHVCRAHCESCGTAIANTCNRGRRHVTPEIECERLKAPLSDLAGSRCCSMRASCRRTF